MNFTFDPELEGPKWTAAKVKRTEEAINGLRENEITSTVHSCTGQG